MDRRIFPIVLMYQAIFVLLLLASLPVSGQHGTWTRMPDMPFSAVAPSACLLDQHIYVFGGDRDGKLQGTDYGDSIVQVYDIATRSWEKH